MGAVGISKGQICERHKAVSSMCVAEFGLVTNRPSLCTLCVLSECHEILCVKECVRAQQAEHQMCHMLNWRNWCK